MFFLVGKQRGTLPPIRSSLPISNGEWNRVAEFLVGGTITSAFKKRQEILWNQKF